MGVLVLKCVLVIIFSFMFIALLKESDLKVLFASHDDYRDRLHHENNKLKQLFEQLGADFNKFAIGEAILHIVLFALTALLVNSSTIIVGTFIFCIGVLLDSYFTAYQLKHNLINWMLIINRIVFISYYVVLPLCMIELFVSMFS